MQTTLLNDLTFISIIHNISLNYALKAVPITLLVKPSSIQLICALPIEHQIEQFTQNNTENIKETSISRPNILTTSGSESWGGRTYLTFY